MEQQNERHPLIVLEDARFAVGLVFGQVLVHRRIERVRHPAYLVNIINVILYKMTRRPTNDLLRAELFIRNDYRENNKKYDCVFVIEPIGDHRVIAMMTEY